MKPSAVIIAAASAILAGENMLPVKTALSAWERKALRRFINQPTDKRAKVKAARKQRQRK
jgi:hypothetical protein